MTKVIAIIDQADRAADCITLDQHERHRRRVRMVSDGGREFLLDLPKARLLRNGEGLQLDNGEVIEVRAKPESLYRVVGRDQRHLLTLAWQLGNRHLPAQIESDHILIRHDHVICDMLLGLGAKVEAVVAAFDPEGGAYAHDHNHGHDHDR